jgi:hypothetical protein
MRIQMFPKASLKIGKLVAYLPALDFYERRAPVFHENHQHIAKLYHPDSLVAKYVSCA